MWKGPAIDGITQSMIQKFCECPFRFYLYAIKGLVDPGELPDNLTWGDSFHKGLELYVRSKDLNESIIGMLEYADNKYPNHSPTWSVSLPRMLRRYKLTTLSDTWETEVTFEKHYTTKANQLVLLRGKMDGVCYNHSVYGKAMLEHKCKGRIDPILLADEIKQDLQCNFYMYQHELEWVHYDLILIPEAQKYAPKRNYNESVEEWMERLFTGPCGNYQIFPIHQYQHYWLHQSAYCIPRDTQQSYWETTIDPLLQRMCRFWEHVNQPDFDPLNQAFYNEFFYKMPVRMFNGSFTEKFKCSYHGFLTGTHDLDDLVSIPSLFSELEEL